MALAAAMMLLLSLAGCAAPSPTPATPEDPLGRSLAQNAAASSSGGSKHSVKVAGHGLLAGTDNGLEVRKCTIVDQPGVIAAMARHMHGSVVDPDTQSRLERNGLRVVRVPVDSLEGLLSELGGTNLNLSEWHGQAVDWRAVQRRPIGSLPRPIAVDGNVFRYVGGEMLLNLRAWTVQMEDGPWMHLELLPGYQFPRNSDYRNLLGQASAGAWESYPSMALDVQLQSGFAYILFGEAPQTHWPATNAEHVAAESLASKPARSNERSVGPLDPSAEEAAPPTTFGEFMLLGDRQPPMRGLVVFIPHIAPALFPPQTAPNQVAGDGFKPAAEPAPGPPAPQANRKGSR